MRIYADPTRCPDCLAEVPAGAPRCESCDLVLAGSLGAQLFATLRHADVLLERMRAASRPSAPVVAAPVAPAFSGAGQAALPPLAPGAARGSSVPKILLSVGALCVLVAAVVFLAVTWSLLGITGRTLVLVGMTAAAAALTTWVAGRGLRGAVEALGLVTLGLATLDVLGARSAGWLGSPTEAAFLVGLGAAGWAASMLAVRFLVRTPAAAFRGGEIVAAVGAFTAGVGLATADWWSTSFGLLVAVLLTGTATATAAALRRQARPATDFAVALVGTASAAGIFWAALFLAGLEAIGGGPTVRSAWVELDVWPLIAAGTIGLAVAAVPGVARTLRVVSANLGALALAVAALAPAFDGPATTFAVALVALLLALSVVTVAVPRPWGMVTALPTAAGAVALTGWLIAQMLTAAISALELSSLAWGADASVRLPGLTDDTPLGAPWLAPLMALTLVALAAAALYSAAPADAAATQVRRVVAPGAALVLGAVVAMLLLLPSPAWLVIALLVAVAAALALGALRRVEHQTALAGTSAAVLLAALIVGFASEGLTLAATVAAIVVAVALHLRGGRVVTDVAGVATAALLALLSWTIGALLDAPSTWTALVGLLALAALGILRRRVAVELGTLAATAPLAFAGLTAYDGVAGATLGASDVATGVWLAVYLTVVGAAVSVVALLRSDRRQAGWLGGALLAMATWVRLGDLGVETPEAYTLPSALALVVVGSYRMRRDPAVSSLHALAPGLALGLLPSLLWTLDEPISLRALLLGIACLGLVLLGSARRIAAPLVAGAAAGTLLVLRESAPWIDMAVPRWALIGAAGSLLIALGVTWESRLREARAVAGYVRDLR